MLIGLLMLTESCSSRRYYRHHKPKQVCKGGDWGGNLMEKRIHQNQLLFLFQIKKRPMPYREIKIQQTYQNMQQ